MNENVLIVPASGIAALLQGSFTTANLEECLNYILANNSFRSRALVEEDPTLKQIIPYVVVSHNGQHLLTRRTNRQTEARLHGKYSLGIGGHINDTEVSLDGRNIIQAGLERELDEEIHLLGQRQSLSLVGIISDNSTPVGQVHLGLVFLLKTDSPAFTVMETELMTAEWAGHETLLACLPKMETWSQIVFEQIIAPLNKPRANEILAK